MTKWHIVPLKDPYTLMCRDANGNFYLGRKEHNNEGELEFDTEQAANDYIEDYFKTGRFKAEKFWILDGWNEVK